MNITLRDLFAPLRRNAPWMMLYGALFTILILLGLFFFAPSTQKTTLYGTVVPVGVSDASTHYHSLEGAGYMAETIGGWAKDPAFRDEILKQAGVDISNFRQKLSIRKQNRTNIFITLRLKEDEIQHRDQIIKALQGVLAERIETYNTSAASLFSLSNTRPVSEIRTIPLSWQILFALLFGFGLSFFGMYISEAIRGKASFLYQLRELFPGSPMLQIHDLTDAEVLAQFLSFIENPKLIGTHGPSETDFDLYGLEHLEEFDTPVLVVHMGKTHMRDLENLVALCGEASALVILNS